MPHTIHTHYPTMPNQTMLCHVMGREKCHLPTTVHSVLTHFLFEQRGKREKESKRERRSRKKRHIRVNTWQKYSVIIQLIQARTIWIHFLSDLLDLCLSGVEPQGTHHVTNLVGVYLVVTTLVKQSEGITIFWRGGGKEGDTWEQHQST